MSRVNNEYYACTAEIGCTACARRIVVALASDNPKNRNFSRRNELRHRFDGLFNGSVGIDAVLIVHINYVDAQPFERSLA